MSRKEFMERLEKLLWNISDSEREEALQYYNDYFDDAGVENESSVIEDLGSPEQVAAKIKAGLSDSASEFSEQGYQDTRFRNSQEVISRNQARQEQNAQNETNRQPEKSGTNVWKIVAIVLLCILCAPVIVPVCGAVLAVLFSIVVGVAAGCFGIVVAGFAVLLAGIAVIGVGIAQMIATPAVGLALAGVGCLIFALGVLLSLLTIWCCVKILPWLIRGIVSLIKFPFRKAGANK